MAKASAGRILILPKGNYQQNVQYSMLDLVFYNGNSWLAKQTIKNIEPNEQNSAYWHKMTDIITTQANLTTTVPGEALDAVMGKTLKGMIDDVSNELTRVKTEVLGTQVTYRVSGDTLYIEAK